MYYYDNNIKLSNYVDNNSIINGAGYSIDLLPGDYKGIFIPYAGHITNIIKGSDYLSLIIESDYYIAPYIHERAYLSVMNGNSTYQGSGVGATDDRYYPDILKIQENSKLVYYLIILFSSKSKIIYRKKISTNQWMEQGTEILYIDDPNNIGCLFVVNRPIDFVNDIKIYNNYPVHTYSRCRDIIGILN